MRKAIICLVLFLAFFSVFSKSSYAWLSEWNYRRPINITELSGNTLTDYQVAINITYDSGMQPDFSDLRFTYVNSSEEYEIPYWIESYSASNWAYVWVKVPSIPASGYAYIYVYYGNPLASSVSNSYATFHVYDDFNDGVLNSTWTWDRLKTSNTYSEANGYLTITHLINTYAHIQRPGLPLNFEAIARVQQSSGTEASWAMALSIWFNQYDWVQMQIRPGGAFCFNYDKDGTMDGVCGGSVSADTWYWVMLRCTASTCYGYYSADGTSWTLLNSTSRASTWTIDSNSLVIVGHGYEQSASAYPNPHFNNDYSSPGSATTSKIDEVRVRNYADPEPTYNVGEEENFFLTIFSPQPTTYDSIYVPLNFTVYGNQTSYPCWKTLNGETSYLGIIQNASYYYENLTAFYGTNQLTITCQHELGDISGSVTFWTNITVEIRAFDENSLEQILFDIFIYNSTNSFYRTNLTELKTYYAEIPTGNITIVVRNSSYVERNYYVSLTRSLNLSAYLLKSGEGVYITYATMDNMHRLQPGILVSALRFINSSWKTVAQSRSDSQGKGYLYLYPWTVYKIKAEKDYVESWIEEYYPNPNYILSIVLGEEIQAPEMKWVLDSITYYIQPYETYVQNSTTFRFFVSSSDGDIERYGMNITWISGWNSSLLYSHEVTDNPSGGLIEVEVNLTNKTGRIKVDAWFKRENYANYEISKEYIIWFSYSYLPSILNFFWMSGLSPLTLKFIALVISGAGAGAVRRITGAGIVFLIILGFFTAIGWFDWLMFILVAIVVIGAILLRYKWW